jgi:hypothetical protein
MVTSNDMLAARSEGGTKKIKTSHDDKMEQLMISLLK